MTRAQLEAAIRDLFPLCVNVVGFHDLLVTGRRERIGEDRCADYERQFMEFSCELARRVVRIGERMSSPPSAANDDALD